MGGLSSVDVFILGFFIGKVAGLILCRLLHLLADYIVKNGDKDNHR